MRKKAITVILIILPIAIYFGLRSNQSDSSSSYLEEINRERQEKEDFMKSSASSPFVNGKANYKPLKYFPINPEFKVKATVTKLTDLEYVNIGESDGSSKRYLKYARLDFDIKGQSQQLMVLKPTGFGQMNVLFTAFVDETSSVETYGGGRYLDLSFKNASTITLDFNKAYNPYCAYNEGFSCPLPPRENLLSVRIEAGEKNYHED